MRSQSDFLSELLEALDRTRYRHQDTVSINQRKDPRVGFVLLTLSEKDVPLKLNQKSRFVKLALQNTCHFLKLQAVCNPWGLIHEIKGLNSLGSVKWREENNKTKIAKFYNLLMVDPEEFESSEFKLLFYDPAWIREKSHFLSKFYYLNLELNYEEFPNDYYDEQLVETILRDILGYLPTEDGKRYKTTTNISKISIYGKFRNYKISNISDFINLEEGRLKVITVFLAISTVASSIINGIPSLFIINNNKETLYNINQETLIYITRLSKAISFLLFYIVLIGVTLILLNSVIRTFKEKRLSGEFLFMQLLLGLIVFLLFTYLLATGITLFFEKNIWIILSMFVTTLIPVIVLWQIILKDLGPYCLSLFRYVLFNKTSIGNWVGKIFCRINTRG